MSFPPPLCEAQNNMDCSQKNYLCRSRRVGWRFGHLIFIFFIFHCFISLIWFFSPFSIPSKKWQLTNYIYQTTDTFERVVLFQQMPRESDHHSLTRLRTQIWFSFKSFYRRTAFCQLLNLLFHKTERKRLVTLKQPCQDL